MDGVVIRFEVLFGGAKIIWAVRSKVDECFITWTSIQPDAALNPEGIDFKGSSINLRR
jgi:hypothetical protein